MTKFLRVVISGLFIMICMQSMAGYGQDFDKQYIIHPLVGAEIDQAERDKYHLFPEIKGFQCASAYKIHNNRYYLAVTVREEETGLERSSLLLRDNRAIQKIRLQIEGIGRILHTSTRPPGVMTKEEKIALRNKVGATSELLQHPRRFFILNNTLLTGIDLDKTEWKSAYSMGAYSYYSLSDKVAIGYRFAFTQCTINERYNLMPAADRASNIDLSKYTFDTASGNRSMIELLPSIRIAMLRTRDTILSMQYSIGLYLLRASEVEIKGYKWEENEKSIVKIFSEGWGRCTIVDKIIYDESGTPWSQRGLPAWEDNNVAMGRKGSKLGCSVGLSCNIKNIVDIQPTFTFVSRDVKDMIDIKNCYLSISLSLIVPEEIIVNPLQPVPLN